MHPLRLTLLGAALVGVGCLSWAAHRQMLTRRSSGDERAGHWRDTGELGAWRLLVPSGTGLVVAGTVGGLTDSAAIGWIAGAISIAGLAAAYRPVLRRFPHLDIGQRASSEQLWRVRLSGNRGPVFWAIVGCTALLILLGLVFAVVN